MTLEHATMLAEELCAALIPFTERCIIAGSIRRKKELPKDIEIVCIPRSEPLKDMFGAETGRERDPGFLKFVGSLERIKGDPSGKYTQRIYKGQTVDLFMVTEETWIPLLVIRTGDADFTRKLMTRALKLGLEQKDGQLFGDRGPIAMTEERQYFDVLNLPYIEPELRDEMAFRTPA